MPLSIPDLSKLIQGASEKLIEREEDEASKHNKKSDAYYDEAGKAYRSGHPERWPAADRATEKGDEESKKADDIDKQIEGKKEMLALVKETLKAAQKR
jgi:hypothetical protein